MPAKHPSPALVVAAAALFFALGGSAFAIGERSGSQSAATASCANGSVKAIAFVRGDPTKGLANLSDTYTSAAKVFGPRWSCRGGAIQVRRSGTGFDLRFVGISAVSAVIHPTGQTPGSASFTKNADGSIHVTIAGPTGGGAYSPRQDLPFMVAVL